MENSAEPVKQSVPNKIDNELPNRTYITAWKDRDEFMAVYNGLFQSAADDIAAKEEAVQWLNVWILRLNKKIPVSIPCTLTILEAQLFDQRTQRAGVSNITDLKSIYAGSFTRFINFIVERSRDYRYKQTTIAKHVRSIGIETFVVELRHLCSHNSVSVSIEVFRRSAQYCIDWLKESFWELQKTYNWPVTVQTMRGNVVPAPMYRVWQRYEEAVTTHLRAYDIAVTGVVLGCTTIDDLKSVHNIDGVELLEGYKMDDLTSLVPKIVARLRKTAPRFPTVGMAIVKIILSRCKRMVMEPLRHYGKKDPPKVWKIHSRLFQYLASVGGVQFFFERFMTICESETEDSDLRQAASCWALKIVQSYQVLQQFKMACKPLREQSKFYETQEERAKVTYQGVHRSDITFDTFVSKKLKDVDFITIGKTVDCPWHLEISYAFLRGRLLAVNPYTSEIVMNLLSMAELTGEQRSDLKKAEQLLRTYMEQKHTDGKEEESTAESEPPMKLYTVDDFVQLARGGTKRRPEDEKEGEQGEKKIKRFGLWSESSDVSAWEKCPLGTCPVAAL